MSSQQTERRKAQCLMCHSHCRVTVLVKDGQLLGMEPDEDHPYSKIYAPQVLGCWRARAVADWFYHPDHLNYPLKRVGERGEGKWERISWAQAFDEIGAKLDEVRKKYGPEAIAISGGTYRTDTFLRGRFLSLLGSPNIIGQAEICWGLSLALNNAMFGWWLFPVVTRETKCLITWGGGTPMLFPPIWRAFLNAKASGADLKLIVVDPRRTATADRADIWLQPRPGTDPALALGMINVIVKEGLYDKEFVDKWCFGFDKLVERADDYPPERVAEITWVPADKIREAARLYATSKPAASVSGMGIEHLANSNEALQARFILPAITGNLNIRGGDLLPGAHPDIVHSTDLELWELMPPEQKKKQLGRDRFKLMGWQSYDIMEPIVKKVWGKMCAGWVNTGMAHGPTVYRAMLTGKPYPVKAMITNAANPMVTQSNTKLVYKALKNLDLYVVHDFWMTPSAELADYVTPAASFLERPCIFDGDGTAKSVFACEAALPAQVEGKYDHRTDYDFFRELGIRLGQAEYWPWKTMEELCDYRLAPLGYTLKQFMIEKKGVDIPRTEYKRYEQTGFATPTGKVELYSTVLERLGYDPLPKYEEPPESPTSTPELAREYPLILITGSRFNPMYHSEHRQIERLRKQHPEPLFQIHPDTASELGIGQGDWVWIETPRGRVRQKTQVWDGIDPRVVHAEHGWWFPELPGEEPWLHGVWESNINVVTNDDPEVCNQINGGWPLRAMLCKVYKCKTY